MIFENFEIPFENFKFRALRNFREIFAQNSKNFENLEKFQAFPKFRNFSNLQNRFRRDDF